MNSVVSAEYLSIIAFYNTWAWQCSGIV